MSTLLKLLLLCFIPLQLLYGFSFAKPSIIYDRYAFGNPSNKHIPLNIYLHANNPNIVAITGVKIQSDYFIEGKHFLSAKESLISLQAKQNTPIIINADMVYTKLLQSAKSITNRLLEGKKTIPVTVKIRMHGNPMLSVPSMKFLPKVALPIDETVQITIHVPIPNDLFTNPQKSLDTLKRLF